MNLKQHDQVKIMNTSGIDNPITVGDVGFIVGRWEVGENRYMVSFPQYEGLLHNGNAGDYFWTGDFLKSSINYVYGEQMVLINVYVELKDV